MTLSKFTSHAIGENVPEESEISHRSSLSFTNPAYGTRKSEILPPYSIIQTNNNAKSHSIYFSIAEKKAHVPFLNQTILECDISGREYVNVEHDITLRIPSGAIPKGKKIHFEVGVAMYGPFTFPEGTQPISPILWLCILEEDVILEKPFQVILPHFLTGMTVNEVLRHQLKLAKATHNNCTPQADHNLYYSFIPLNSNLMHHTTNEYRAYCSFEATHCCFFCLLAKVTPELAMDAGYCLIQIEVPQVLTITPLRNVVHFILIYFLETCLRVCTSVV